MYKKLMNAILIIIIALELCSVAAASNAAIPPAPSGVVGGSQFYVSDDESFRSPPFQRSKNILKVSDEGAPETVWIWFRGGVRDFRIYEVEYIPGPMGEYGKDEYKLTRLIYSADLSAADLLEFKTTIQEIIPNRAIWFNDPDRGPRAYLIGWNGDTGGVHLREIKRGDSGGWR